MHIFTCPLSIDLGCHTSSSNHCTSRSYTYNSCTFSSSWCFNCQCNTYKILQMLIEGFDHTFISAGVLKVTHGQVRALAVTSASIMQEHTWTCMTEYKFPPDY